MGVSPRTAQIKVFMGKQVLEEGYGPMSKRLDVSKGALWAFINKPEYDPTGPELRKKLGLSEIITQEVYRNTIGRFS